MGVHDELQAAACLAVGGSLTTASMGWSSEASVTSLDCENKDHILVAILKCNALIALFHTSSQRQQLQCGII